MSIEDRNLKPGTVLVARYKKQDVRAEVVAGEDDKIRYRLEDGREFASPSAAGSAVMGGTACNGWRFWSVEGDESKAAKPVACGECKQEFPSSREAAAHMRDAHGSVEAPGNGA